MSDETGATAPAPPEAVVRVQAISDPKAFKRHLLRMFDRGQPLYTDYFDPDYAWKLWPDMVADFVDDWGFIYIESDGPDRTRIALALTFSMPTGTDPRVNETAVLAVASKAFAGHDRVWVVTSTLADAPNAYQTVGTILKWIGQDKEAEERERDRLGAPSPMLLAPSPSALKPKAAPQSAQPSFGGFADDLDDDAFLEGCVDRPILFAASINGGLSETRA